MFGTVGVYFGMFDQTFVNTGGPTRKPWTVAVSIAGQSVLVGAALIVPILHPGILQPKLDTPIWVHLQPMKELPKAEASHTPAASHPSVRRVFVPIDIPKGVRKYVDTDIGDTVPQDFAMVGPGTGNAGPGGDIFSNLLPSGAPVIQPKEAPKARPTPLVPSGPVSVGGDVQAAKLIYGPKPAYPRLAVVSRVQGTVKIQAIIAADGTIEKLHVMSGPPLLIQAAKDAVSRWRYQATLLNGHAVEVSTEIDVNFILGN